MINKDIDFLDIPDVQSKEAYEMAAEIRGERLEDYCLYYNMTGSAMGLSIICGCRFCISPKFFKIF